MSYCLFNIYIVFPFRAVPFEFRQQLMAEQSAEFGVLVLCYARHTDGCFVTLFHQRRCRIVKTGVLYISAVRHRARSDLTFET